MISLDKLRRLEQEGLISIRAKDDLIIANYTAKTQYEARWDEHTVQCRGLILRLDQPWPEGARVTEVVALPWSKFFNVGEGGRVPTTPIVEVTDKVDGSLGILYRHRGEYHVATRGSFDSEQAQWATEFLRKNHDLSRLPPNYTLLWEIVYPGSRVVVDYQGEEALVLLGIRDRFSGRDWSLRGTCSIGEVFGFFNPKIYCDKGQGINELSSLEAIQEQARRIGADREGFVIRCADGSRWKIKGRRYLELHRLLSHFTPRQVLEALAEGTWEDLREQVPGEWLPTVKEWFLGFNSQAYKQLQYIQELYTMAPLGSRKELALWAQTFYPQLQHPLYALYDGQDLLPIIYKNMLKKYGKESE